MLFRGQSLLVLVIDDEPVGLYDRREEAQNAARLFGSLDGDYTIHEVPYHHYPNCDHSETSSFYEVGSGQYEVGSGQPIDIYCRYCDLLLERGT
jgi:hypothetical protein